MRAWVVAAAAAAAAAAEAAEAAEAAAAAAAATVLSFVMTARARVRACVRACVRGQVIRVRVMNSGEGFRIPGQIKRFRLYVSSWFTVKGLGIGVDISISRAGRKVFRVELRI